jgi:hypothetical protein
MSLFSLIYVVLLIALIRLLYRAGIMPCQFQIRRRTPPVRHGVSRASSTSTDDRGEAARRWDADDLR